MQFGPESLLPPLVAIVLAIVSRKVVLPLAAGVLMGAFLLAIGDPQQPWYRGPAIFIHSMHDSIFEKSHLQALTFSLSVGAMVGVLERCGGMRALIKLLSRRIRSRRGAQTMIASSGLAIFFDDYANTLLIGGTMRSTADRYRISREKLAYLVDSTAAPVAGLALVSTWAAIEISYMGDGLRNAGITDPSAAFQMFIYSIPYRFYPWLAIAMVFVIAGTERDFGPMRAAEAAMISGTSIDPKSNPQDGLRRPSDWLWMAAVAPIVVCVYAVICVLVITGANAAEQLDLNNSWLRIAGEILGSGDSYVALIVGGLLGLVIAIATHQALGGCTLLGGLRSALAGARQMMPAVIILWFAWALSGMTEEDKLDTGGYLATVLSDRLDSRVLPTVVFLTAGLVAFATGTSWGTMGILTPLSITLSLKLDPSGGPDGAIALATCGAVLAGAIFGDHCSPISDTTVLSSRASDCDHVAHVRTQMPYALVVAVVCVFIGTLPAAFGFSPWGSLAMGVIALTVIVRCCGKQSRETGADA